MKRMVILALGLALLPSWQSIAASPGHEFADYVAYARVEVSGSYTFVLDCSTPQAVPEWILASGLEDGTEWLWGSMFVSVGTLGRRSTAGRLVQVDDATVYEEQPRVEQGHGGMHGLGTKGSVSVAGDGPFVAHFAWAWWGPDADCTLVVAGESVPINRLPGTHGRYVGPQSFRTGAFGQLDGVQASAGRIYATELAGGPLFARISAGNRTDATFTSDTHPLPKNCDVGCSYGQPAASTLSVAVNGAETDGGAHAQLWLIDIPPGLSP